MDRYTTHSRCLNEPHGPFPSRWRLHAGKHLAPAHGLPTADISRLTARLLRHLQKTRNSLVVLVAGFEKDKANSTGLEPLTKQRGAVAW